MPHAGVCLRRPLRGERQRPVTDGVYRAALGTPIALRAANGNSFPNNQHPFDLSKAPLLRVELIPVDNETNHLILDMPHIVSDGVSMVNMVREIQMLYAGKPLPPLKLRYRDYAEWWNRRKAEGAFEKQAEYWLNSFKGELPQLDLPTDHPRPAVRDYRGGCVEFHIGKQETAQIEQQAQQTGTTPFMVLFTAYTVLLSRLTRQEDIVVGTPTAGRKQPELEPLIGVFVNTLAIRNYPTSTKTIQEYLEEVKTNALQAFENQDYQFEDLLERLAVRRDTSRNPLFDAMLVLQNNKLGETATSQEENHLYEEDGSRIRVTPCEIPHTTAKFDLTLEIFRETGEMPVSLEYSSTILKEETAQRIARYIQQTVTSLLSRSKEPGTRLHEIEIIPAKEKQQLLIDFNKTKREYPENKTLPAIFQDQARQTPYKIAVVGTDGHTQITYGELNRKTNQLAHYLANAYGIKPGNIVGISLDRSIHLIISVLAIMKTGAGYVAIDPNYPEERQAHMLRDSGIGLVICDETQTTWADEFTGQQLNLSKEWNRIATQAADNPTPKTRPGDILYVIYTSGSTGTPNGAVLTHATLTNLILWQHHHTTIETALNTMQFTSINFCVSFQEIMTTLTAGGRLLLIDDVQRQDIHYLHGFIKQRRVENLYLPFSYLNFLFTHWYIRTEHNTHNDTSTPLKHIITAGEQLKITTGLRRYLKENPQIHLHNHYGSSEMHVVTSYTLDASNMDKHTLPPAGNPITNMKIYILDDNLNPTPIGVWGEIFSVGDTDMSGYINNPQLTGEKLVPLPGLLPGNRKAYRSGDIGRRMPDGNIQLRGRKDYQVKIRGFRVEPGEIENKLLETRKIRDCLVMIREDENNEKYLVAYITPVEQTSPTEDGKVHLEEMKKAMRHFLPEYMLPQLVELENLPLMPNGKVDRDKLPTPKRREAAEYIPPYGIIEEKLARLWTEVLKTGETQVGRNSDFFQLGGHSLKAAILIAKIRQTFNAEIPLAQLFKTTTLKNQAQTITKAAKKRYQAITTLEKKEYYPLSSAQKRLYLLYKLEPKSTGYNMPTTMQLEGKLHHKKLEETFQNMIKKHESLRTTFHMINGEPVQVINDGLCLRRLSEGQGKAPLGTPIALRAGNSDRLPQLEPFDLSQAPLLRVNIVKINEAKHLLMVDMHHIISDGISTALFVKEFVTLYQNGLSGQEQEITYKDYAQWQQERINSEAVKKQEAYWLKEYADEIPVLELPTDYPRPTVQSLEGRTINMEIGSAETGGLNKLAADEGSTLFMVLLALLQVLFSRISNQEDIVTGTHVAGRLSPQLEEIIGIFINTLAIRSNPGGNKTFKHYLAEVKAKTLSAFDNQEYQFEDLVEKLSITRDAGRNPLFDVVLDLQNVQQEELELPGLAIKPYHLENRISKFDQVFHFREEKGKLQLSLDYAIKLFKEETIKRYLGYFKRIIEEVLADKKNEIGKLEIISPQEKEWIQTQLNANPVTGIANKTLHQLFQQQVRQRPHAQAVTYGTKQLTYSEINKRANRLARHLNKKGIAPGAIVAIMMNPALEMITATLAVLKAGGAYLPIDPDYPEERVKFMLADSSTAILLTRTTDLKTETPLTHPIDRIDLDKENPAIENEPADNLQDLNSPADTAYIIYTSGTTGKPKGVMVEHRNIVSLMEVCKGLFQYGPNDTWTKFHSYCFDFSVWEIYGPLLYGGKLVLVPPITARDPKNYLQLIIKEKVTILNQTPTVFYQLIEADQKRDGQPGLNHRLRYVVFGGEALKPAKLATWKSKYPTTRLINMYGITETTVHVTFKEITEKEINTGISNIGVPIPTLSITILNKHGQIQPTGVPGEMCVSGLGVARGYLNRPKLTAERFVVPPEAYLYRSGDLARINHEGELEYLGRIDHQVKIRGNRVETGEIEQKLLTLEKTQITGALVKALQDQRGDNTLCAYVTIAGGQELNIPRVREELAGTLPIYMIPGHFIRLEQFPVTATGKVDRKKLPLPKTQREQLGTTYTPPKTEKEKAIAAIWQETLNTDKVGIHDNFFDLGGTSLDIVRLGNHLKETLQKEIKLVTLFEYPTIATFTQYLEQTETPEPPTPENKKIKEAAAIKVKQGRQKMKGRMKRE
ncbi:MAG: amino acid adenylation domain-containing protein [bacterium]|nr:amino acid adenylation domain-containing protein [bacterium]